MLTVMQIKRNSSPLGTFDVYRAAVFLVGQYGISARAVASRRAKVLLKGGDVRGAKMWRSLIEPIDQLTRSRRPNEAVN